MKKQTFIEWLETAGACSDGVAWAKENKIKSSQEAWEKLERTDWMFWLAEAKKATFLKEERKLRHLAADYAEESLAEFEKYYPDDKRPRLAIQAARDFADGKIDEAARSAARSAAWSAARSAAWSAAESAARSAARSAAESAARSAAWSAARSAAWSAARSAARSAQAKKLRKLFKKAFKKGE